MAIEAFLRVRMSAQDAHYGGDLVAGAKMMSLFGDLATELAIKHDCDEGLLRVYDKVEFLAPVYAGDFIEARGKIVSAGNTSRRIECEARKVIAASRDPAQPSAAYVLEQPIVVARAVGVTVVPKDMQRKRKEAG